MQRCGERYCKMRPQRSGKFFVSEVSIRKAAIADAAAIARLSETLGYPVSAAIMAERLARVLDPNIPHPTSRISHAASRTPLAARIRHLAFTLPCPEPR